MSGSSLQDDRIAALAYAYWIERGSPFGSPEVDWYRAIDTLTAPSELPLAALPPGLSTGAPTPIHRRRR